ncbi:MAG: hypothetical protein J3K34DRAFT_410296 [Monoraphidium minutum]|nr:MAG: hypothetical protein J3K34DRAFT_410296 [Monoraphidium minutum]
MRCRAMGSWVWGPVKRVGCAALQNLFVVRFRVVSAKLGMAVVVNAGREAGRPAAPGRLGRPGGAFPSATDCVRAAAACCRTLGRLSA